MDLKEIKQIIELMDKHGLSSFELDREGNKISLKKPFAGDGAPAPVAAPAPAPPPAAAAPAQAPAPAPEPEAPAESSKPTINSPMVGTFYRRPSPEEKNFVSVGDSVDEDTIICIVEAMKVMNEIKAETRGTITKVLLEDGTPVQYGEPLFEITPA